MSTGIVMSASTFASSPKKPSSSSSSAKRCLFGKASSASDADSFCSRLLNEIINEKCQQWEFDFMTGVPFPSSSNFEYQQVPSSTVPGFYRCTTLAGTSTNKLGRQTSDSSLSSDSENFDPSSSALLNSSMEFEEDSNEKSFRLPSGKPVSTPKKVVFQRQPRFGKKTTKASRKPRTLNSPTEKLTSHMPLHVSKRIVKKSAAAASCSKISSSAASTVAFIFNESATATTARNHD